MRDGSEPEDAGGAPPLRRRKTAGWFPAAEFPGKPACYNFFTQKEVCPVLSGLSVEQYATLAAGLFGLLAVLIALVGVWQLRRAPRQAFFLVRQQTAASGWRLLFTALGVLLLAGLVQLFGPPAAFNVISPTPTSTLTPSLTLTPSVTSTPTVTFTPSITPTPSRTLTPSITPTPSLPEEVLADFTSNVEPAPELNIGALTFVTRYTEDLLPLDPDTVFFNPVQRVAALFQYRAMNRGVQFTVLWFRQGKLAFWQSFPWDRAANGTGVVWWDAVPEYFEPASYEVQIFVGHYWRSSGRFDIVGPVPSNTATLFPSKTRLPSQTPSPLLPPSASPTPRPSLTPRPTDTLWPWPTNTPKK
jgi:hypothetical protein